MITINNIYKSFENRTILDNISTTFETGKTNLIIGQSGSGKTVLLKSLVGLHAVDSGDIFYDDINFSSLSFKDRKQIRQHVGMIFQGGALLDSSTVEENIMLPLNLFTDQSLEEKRERVNFCLKRVNLNNVNSMYPAELSGGMIKRVAIARAIVLNPKYLFCDEPNSGLDPYTSILIDRLIYDLTKEFNMTTVINTHDMNSILEIGDKIGFIYQGSLLWQGDKHSILKTDCKEVLDFVCANTLARNIIEGR